MVNNMKSFRKVFRSEFLIQFTAGKLMAIFISIMLPLTVLLLLDKIEFNKEELEKAKKILITEKELILERSNVILSGPLLGQGITYVFLTRIVFIFKDKNTLDKNRLTFLKYNKHLISFIKIFIDVLLFILHVFLLMTLGMIIIIHHLGGSFENQVFSRLIKVLISLTIFYIFTTYGVKLIDSCLNKNLNKKLLLGIWLLFTVGYYLICAIVLTREDEFASFYQDNINWIIYVPFLNLLNPAMILYRVYIHDWVELIPMLTLTILFIGATWNSFTINFKEFLCA